MSLWNHIISVFTFKNDYNENRLEHFTCLFLCRFAAKLFSDLSVSAMIIMYMTYTWGNAVHKQSMRKNPADFENDE